MRPKLSKFIAIFITLGFAFLFLAKFGGPGILKLYIKTGVGDCRKIPILCMQPQENRFIKTVNQDFLNKLIPYSFPKVSVSLPRGFLVVQESIKKTYYKKSKQRQSQAAIYILHQDPDFFINLFPQVHKRGVNDDEEFIKQTMYANLGNIKDLTDAFFVIMKGIFIPDLGDQQNVRMVSISSENKKGFINYNLGREGNFFDCNIIDKKGNFFKLYIKDKDRILDIDKVLTIISTLHA